MTADKKHGRHADTSTLLYRLYNSENKNNKYRIWH